MPSKPKTFNEWTPEKQEAWRERQRADKRKHMAKAWAANPEYIIEQCPGLTRAHLAKFEAIGRGSLEPRLLLNGSIGYQRLAASPVSAQRKALKDGIQLYEAGQDGEITHRLIRAEELSPSEALQVFSQD